MIWTLWFACASEPPPAAPPPPPAPVKKRSTPKSHKPRPKPCLGTADAEGDRGMSASRGLTPEQVSASMRNAFPAMAQCVAQSGAAPTSTLRLRVKVSCGGVVDRVDVLDAADWPVDAVSCTTAAVSVLEFPAHGLPDGDEFEFPLTWKSG